MGTVTITSAGFAALPAQPPKNWVTNINWPAGSSINGTKVYNLSDVDAQQMLSWIATQYNQQLAGTDSTKWPVTITAISIVLAWLQGFIQGTTNSTQIQQTSPAVQPPPINFT